MRLKRTAIAGLLLLSVVGCGGGDDEATPADAAPPAAQEEPSAPPSEAPSEAPAPEPPAEAPAATIPATCPDPAGDSTGALDLTEVGLVSGSDSVDASFAWTGAVPTADAVLWSVTVVSADGNTVRQLGYKIVDGTESEHFVFDFGSAEQTESGGSVELAAQTLKVGFPASAVEDLGNDYKWKAALTVAGEDVDVCEVG